MWLSCSLGSCGEAERVDCRHRAQSCFRKYLYMGRIIFGSSVSLPRLADCLDGCRVTGPHHAPRIRGSKGHYLIWVTASPTLGDVERCPLASPCRGETSRTNTESIFRVSLTVLCELPDHKLPRTAVTCGGTPRKVLGLHLG